MEREATLDQAREFLIHRSAYQLKEADPHSWVIPRLEGAAKTMVMEIQYDEYGSGDPAWMHAELFRSTMIAAGLDGSYGAYLDRLPGTTLATVNLISLFGLHRRWRGALIGHLAAFEMTSSLPNRGYGNGFRRLGFDAEARRFFDEHVVADSVHEVLASDLAVEVASREPALAADIIFGAQALDVISKSRSSAALLRAWRAGASALLEGAAPHTVSSSLSYVLPLRSRPGDEGTEELTGYLEWLSERVELVIVDGSDRSPFRIHRDLWSPFATHVPPADDIRCANGKVRGVLTGLRLATHELVVIADDDVRYRRRRACVRMVATPCRAPTWFGLRTTSTPFRGTRDGIRRGSC